MNKWYITPRRWWNAAPPHFQEPLDAPASLVFLTFTGVHVGYSSDACEQELRKIQQRQMNRGAIDITYNFLIAPNGHIFEGRGWHYTARTPPKFQRFARNSINIALMGDYRFQLPSDNILRSAHNLIRLGVQKNYIAEKFLETFVNFWSVPMMENYNEVLEKLDG